MLAVWAGCHAISPHRDRCAFQINQRLPRARRRRIPGPARVRSRAILELTLAHLTRYSENTPSPEELRGLLARTGGDAYTISRGEFQVGAEAGVCQRRLGVLADSGRATRMVRQRRVPAPGLTAAAGAGRALAAELVEAGPKP